jgi:hypothetical protein
MSALGLGCAETKTEAEDKFFRFFALRMTGLKILGAVIPLRVFTQAGRVGSRRGAGFE